MILANRLEIGISTRLLLDCFLSCGDTTDVDVGLFYNSLRLVYITTLKCTFSRTSSSNNELPKFYTFGNTYPKRVQYMSAAWVSNLCFQPIIHYSLVLYYRMFINKWKWLVAHQKKSKNGCVINR